MAYPYCCVSCLNEHHENCEPKRGSGGFDSGFCVCYVAKHKPETNDFAKSVIDHYDEDGNYVYTN